MIETTTIARVLAVTALAFGINHSIAKERVQPVEAESAQLRHAIDTGSTPPPAPRKDATRGFWV